MNSSIISYNSFMDIEEHLLLDFKPSYYMEDISEQVFFKRYPFNMLYDLKKIEQSPIHHPEGNVWNHTMMVLDNAAMRRSHSRDPRVLMWAALLHDIGKAPATKIRKGKITAYDHDRYGEQMAAKFMEGFTSDIVLINKVTAMVRWHMQILYVVKDLPFADIKSMLNEVPVNEIAILSYCDRLGRGELDHEKLKAEENNVRIFKEKCMQADYLH